MGRSRSVRREVLFAFGVLFAGGILLASLGMAFLLPFMTSSAEAILYLFLLVAADLAIIFVFGRVTLGRTLLEPLDRLVSDVQTIAEGAYDHRIRPLPARELQAVAESVNALAERLIHDQESLADNVRSLDETNVALVDARAQIVRAARLASTGTLASGIAHELGNPLGALMAYVDVARNRVRERGGDTELLDSIRGEAVRIDRIIRSLLSFARPRDGKEGPEDPREVARRVRDLLEAQGKLDDVEDVWNLAEEGIPPILMDPQRLEQVILNLFLNALDALEGAEEPWVCLSIKTEAGPASTLPQRRRGDPPGVDYAHRRRVISAQEGVRITPMATARELVVVTVEDNGPGLPPESLEEVFDPFFTTKEPGKGTGLGLALSAQLVGGMGGEIEAGNREEGGAIFTIRLPAAPSSPAELEEGDQGDGAMGSETSESGVRP